MEEPVELDLDRARTAIVTVGVQEGLVSRAGAVAGFLDMDAVEPAVERLGTVLEAGRSAGCLVVHGRLAFRRGHADAVVNNPFVGAIVARGGLIEDAPGTAVLGAIHARDDIVIDCRRFSAFHGTSLTTMLAKRRVETVLVAGVTLETLVHSTARTAANMGLHVVVVGDACVAATPDAHGDALQGIAFIATPASARDAIDALDRRVP